MTAPTKAAPAKATATKATTKPRKKNPAPPAIDLAALTVTEAAAPVKQSSKGDPATNPAIAWVQASWAEKKVTGKVNGQPTYKGGGRSVTVPNANAGQVVNLIRYAGNFLGIGTAVVTTELTGKDRGKTEIRFCAKSRRQSRKDSDTETGGA